ncbi:MAG: hypothetical protein KC416_01015 [Myxococcales bacterium]|nr:hypothetical protein [Myxococcales bacterium]
MDAPLRLASHWRRPAAQLARRPTREIRERIGRFLALPPLSGEALAEAPSLSEANLLVDFVRRQTGTPDGYCEPECPEYESDDPFYQGFPAISANGKKVVVLRDVEENSNAEFPYRLANLVAEYYDASDGHLLSKYRVMGRTAETTRDRIRTLNHRLQRYRALETMYDYGSFREPRTTATTKLLKADPSPGGWDAPLRLEDVDAGSLVIPIPETRDLHADPYPEPSDPDQRLGCFGEPDSINTVHFDPATKTVVVTAGKGGTGCLCTLAWDLAIRVYPESAWTMQGNAD